MAVRKDEHTPFAIIAQRAERPPCKRQVVSSSLACSSKNAPPYNSSGGVLIFFKKVLTANKNYGIIKKNVCYSFSFHPSFDRPSEIPKRWLKKNLAKFYNANKTEYNKSIGVSPSGKAQDFDSCIQRFKSFRPCQR